MCGNHIKPYSLELGGINPIIVSDKTELNTAAELVLKGITYHRGQCCISNEKCFIHKSVYNDFIECLNEKKLESLKSITSSLLFQPYSVYKNQADFIKLTEHSKMHENDFQKEVIIYENKEAFSASNETFGMFLGVKI